MAFPAIPDDAIDFVRSVFSNANARTATLLSNQPAMHEEGLDFQLIAALDEVGPRVMPTSKVAVNIETHWLGGRHHFMSFEVADIAVVLIVRNNGKQLARKVALLQSKRLYSVELPVTVIDKSDYQIGIGRLVDRGDTTPLTTSRKFSFTPQSMFRALRAGDKQISTIERYEEERRMPVYYAFYNPPDVPFIGSIPKPAGLPTPATPQLGCRVFSSAEVRAVLTTISAGKSPTFAQMRAPARGEPQDGYLDHGWRLERFIADEFMRCKQGRVISKPEDEDLYALLYSRAAPIAVAIAVTIDMPPD